jgi:hypothetical protein
MTNPLKYVVECMEHRPVPASFFEPIAAFNVYRVAEQYARDCYSTNRHNTYRVKQLDCRSAQRYTVIEDLETD